MPPSYRCYLQPFSSTTTFSHHCQQAVLRLQRHLSPKAAASTESDKSLFSGEMTFIKCTTWACSVEVHLCILSPLSDNWLILTETVCRNVCWLSRSRDVKGWKTFFGGDVICLLTYNVNYIKTAFKMSMKHNNKIQFQHSWEGIVQVIAGLCHGCILIRSSSIKMQMLQPIVQIKKQKKQSRNHLQWHSCTFTILKYECT